MKTFRYISFYSLILALMTIIACNPDDNEDEGGGNGNENKAGSLTITVKRKVKEKLQDNYGCLAVIGPNADSMNFFQYETGEVKGSEKPKVFLKNFSELKSQGKVIDTMYMQKGTGLDPLTNEKVGGNNMGQLANRNLLFTRA